MYDQPSASELISAVRLHLETALIPAVKRDPKLYFQTLVAVNVLRVVERELALSGGHLINEWERLNVLEGVTMPAPPRDADLQEALSTRNRTLCQRIRTGDYDNTTTHSALFAHVYQTTVAQLEVANPRLIQNQP